MVYSSLYIKHLLLTVLGMYVVGFALYPYLQGKTGWSTNRFMRSVLREIYTKCNGRIKYEMTNFAWEIKEVELDDT